MSRDSYNSVIFSVTSANEYSALFVGKNFATSQNLTFGPLIISDGQDPTFNNRIAHQLQSLVLRNQTDTLDNADCIAAYAQSYQSTRGNVAVVLDLDHIDTADFNAIDPSGELKNISSYSIIDIRSYAIIRPRSTKGEILVPIDPYPWICYGPRGADPFTPCQVGISSVQANASGWQIPIMLAPTDIGMHYIHVSHCLSERVDQHCRVEMGFDLIVVVTAFIFMMAITLGFTAFRAKNSPLLTTGDAVCSFMERPDSHTREMCLLTATVAKTKQGEWLRKPQVYKDDRRRWGGSVGDVRWWVSLPM